MTSDIAASSLATLGDKVVRVSDVYASRFDIERDDFWHLAKLSEELGEINSAYLALKGRGRRRGKADNELAKALELECADLLAHLLLFARHNDINLDNALQEKWFAHLHGL